MTNFFFHDRAGKILMCGNCGDHEISAQKLPGATLKVGMADCEKNYYSEGEVLTFPEKPTEYHVWDWPSLTWKQDRALAEKAVRNKRAMLLSNTVDKINAVRWAAMSEPERATWDAYRTALLDVTDQAGFPFEVTWPLSPQQ